ncbi:MAG: helix-turn-helix domain-containing protein [Desulfocurvibacter africanus]
MRSLAVQQFPPDLEETLAKVGADIRRARIRRGITQEELAKRAMVNRKTIIQMEKGSPEVGMGILLRTLNVLGIDERFRDLASPELDKVGQALEARKLPNRASKPKRLADMLKKGRK